jgi:hypothetical protein
MINDEIKEIPRDVKWVGGEIVKYLGEYSDNLARVQTYFNHETKRDRMIFITNKSNLKEIKRK